ncbi:MAG: hypothetical protein C4K58_02535 [Flavobacteriaceae bacterium]|nr:MAG: hypothetical protein C4K58_02535 [Flavobacteriaceae bacterium]
MKKRILSTLIFFLGWMMITCTSQKESLSKQKGIVLPKILKENSGLIMLENKLWTFNDSGGEAELYQINPTNGEILKTVKLLGAQNLDWEAITQSQEHFYLADTGNNLAKREQLEIYKIPKIGLNQDQVEVETLRFSYPDFTPPKPGEKTDFDCESLVFYNDSIHLFTKQWTKKGTTHYSLDPNLPTQVAKKKQNYPLGFLLTDACIYPTENGYQIGFLGYEKKGQNFLTLFENDHQKEFSPFDGTQKKIKLHTMGIVGQTEGLVISKDYIYISSEAFKKKAVKLSQKLYRFNRIFNFE